MAISVFLLFTSFLAYAMDSVPVDSPKLLKQDRIAVERIPVGKVDDYKPCLALHPNGELFMVAFEPVELGPGKFDEKVLLFSSRDGGKNWSKPARPKIVGREPYLTILRDGTMFITGHNLKGDIKNDSGYTYSNLHRSTDAGNTWTTTRIGPEGFAPKGETVTSRTVIELPDGSLRLAASDNQGNDYLWRSGDKGKTWDKSMRTEAVGFKSKSQFYGESMLWRSKSGKILALIRVDSKEFPMPGRQLGTWFKGYDDNTDHLVVYETNDDGRTMRKVSDWGNYGEMYPSILRLKDGRLLLTFTVRGLKPPSGLRALPGVERADGFDFDAQHDRIMLDTKTPKDQPSGGGFGNTVQLPDGMLVSACSYRGEDKKTHLEVMRWRIPQ